MRLACSVLTSRDRIFLLNFVACSASSQTKFGSAERRNQTRGTRALPRQCANVTRNVSTFRAGSTIEITAWTADDGAWRDRDAGVYAGRDTRQRQSRDAARITRTQCADRSRKYLSFVRQARTRCDQTFWRPSQVHELEWPDPDR